MSKTTPRSQVGFLADLDPLDVDPQPTLPGMSDLTRQTIDGVVMARVKAFVIQWLSIEAQIQELRADQREIAEVMKAQGVPTRTATMAFKQLKQRRSLDSTLAVFDACQELVAPLLEDTSP